MPIFETPFFSRKTYGQNLGKIISSPVKSYELPEIDGKFPLLGKGFQWDHDFTPWVNLVTWRETFKLLSTSLIFQLPVGLETAQMKGEEC